MIEPEVLTNALVAGIHMARGKIGDKEFQVSLGVNGATINVEVENRCYSYKVTDIVEDALKREGLM
jgi:hypothetical protein